MRKPLLAVGWIFVVMAMTGCALFTADTKNGPGVNLDGIPDQYVSQEQMDHMTQVERDTMHAVVGNEETTALGKPRYDPTPRQPLTTEELNKAMAATKAQPSK